MIFFDWYLSYSLANVDWEGGLMADIYKQSDFLFHKAIRYFGVAHKWVGYIDTIIAMRII